MSSLLVHSSKPRGLLKKNFKSRDFLFAKMHVAVKTGAGTSCLGIADRSCENSGGSRVCFFTVMYLG